MGLHLKKVVLAALALVAAHAAPAGAVSLTQVEEVTGGTVITEGGGVLTLSSSGLGFVTGLLPFAGANVTASGPGTGALTGGTLSIFAGGTPPPPVPVFGTQILAGNFEDAASSAGRIDILYSVTGGTRAAEFEASLVRATLFGAFDATTLAGLGSLTGTTTAAVTSATFTEMQIIPLPAGGLLMLTALGGLVLVARRRAA